ncbi:DUF4232 domain-containing protein [Nocardia colli]|uniref:DUF4232 domain-containing protein n=1 Tax=Nocardia colli TaxID=2545717 RepID=A0A5N0EMK2_9NOCA|nr:DUF4232 domain-containing protein [Nocardia colli]KAA8889225.1 DUF4232 domain-containing protein [Nocardia colli]
MSKQTKRYARIALCAAVIAAAGCASDPASDDAPPSIGSKQISPCAPGRLVLSATEVSPGATHRGVQITIGLINGTPACELSGYPEVEADEGGPAIRADHTLRGYLGGLPPDRDAPPPVTVTDSNIPTAGAASAIVEGMAVDAAGNSCPTYTRLLVTPPDAPAPKLVAATITACTLEVHPLLGSDMHP